MPVAMCLNVSIYTITVGESGDFNADMKSSERRADIVEKRCYFMLFHLTEYICEQFLFIYIIFKLNYMSSYVLYSHYYRKRVSKICVSIYNIYFWIWNELIVGVNMFIIVPLDSKRFT